MNSKTLSHQIKKEFSILTTIEECQEIPSNYSNIASSIEGEFKKLKEKVNIIDLNQLTSFAIRTNLDEEKEIENISAVLHFALLVFSYPR